MRLTGLSTTQLIEISYKGVISMGKTAYLFDEIYMEHDTGYGHPERPQRLAAIDNQLKKNSFYNDLVKKKKKKSDYKYIEAIHDRDYIERVEKEIAGGTKYLDSMDTGVCEKSFEIALYAVGGCLNMCDTIMKDEADTGFCAARPPGHHAERRMAAGFCIFNNIAIAARYLQSEYGLKNIAILDWDVHHGNGTQHSFESDPSIYYISTHQYPHYPGTGGIHENGDGEGMGYTMNIPMRAGTENEEYMTAFKKTIIPEFDKFKPDIVLISAGFDAHERDPLSSINLSTDMFYEFTRMLMGVAEKHSNKKVISFLEGGYDLTALAEGVEAMMNAFVEG